jgi:hypothetical protein
VTTAGNRANDTNPEVTGQTDAGTNVRIYKNGTCNGSPDATGTEAQFESGGITISVPDNSTTTISADAINGANDTSGCSASIDYFEATPAPATPTGLTTDPASPANDNNPKIRGTADSGSTVRVNTTGGCGGSPAVTGSANDFANPGLAISVADNSTTTISADATGPGGTSGCSSSIQYVESTPDNPPPPPGDTTPPETMITSKVPKKTTKKKLTIEFASTESGSFRCQLDKKAPVSCTSPNKTSKLKNGKNTFTVTAIDAVGNEDGSPAVKKLKKI